MILYTQTTIVTLGQSSNDSFPTVMHISLVKIIKENLNLRLNVLSNQSKKEREFKIL